MDDNLTDAVLESNRTAMQAQIDSMQDETKHLTSNRSLPQISPSQHVLSLEHLLMMGISAHRWHT